MRANIGLIIGLLSLFVIICIPSACTRDLTSFIMIPTPSLRSSPTVVDLLPAYAMSENSVSARRLVKEHEGLRRPPT